MDSKARDRKISRKAATTAESTGKPVTTVVDEEYGEIPIGDHPEWKTLNIAMKLLNRRWTDEILHQVSQVRNGKANYKDLPLMVVGNDIKRTGLEIAAFFTEKHKKKKRPRAEGADGKQNGVTAPVFISPELAAFFNKHFARNASGQPPVSKNNIFIRGLATSLMSRYFRLSGCVKQEELKIDSAKGKGKKNDYIRPNAELMELLNTMQEKEFIDASGMTRKRRARVFELEGVSEEGFGYTQLQKLLRYHYPKMTKQEKESKFASINMAVEIDRLKKIREESTAETVAYNEEKKQRQKQARAALRASKPPARRGGRKAAQPHSGSQGQSQPAGSSTASADPGARTPGKRRTGASPDRAPRQ